MCPKLAPDSLASRYLFNKRVMFFGIPYLAYWIGLFQHDSLSCLSKKAAEQSVHLTLGILRKSQAVFCALSFFWLDGFAVPTPAQVTQTVRRWS
jgi:hypothetical protein